MADTFNDVTMQANTYVDLYSLTGIAPGTVVKVRVEGVGG